MTIATFTLFPHLTDITSTLQAINRIQTTTTPFNLSIIENNPDCHAKNDKGKDGKTK